MHCNEEDKQSIKENHRQRYRTLLNATTSTLHTSTRTTTIQEEIIPFNMEEQHTGAETTSNYFNMDNQQTGRAIIFPISHYKETSRTTTTNRIKHAQTANKTLYTSTLHTSTRTTTIQENRQEKANEIHPLHFIDTPPVGSRIYILSQNHTPPLFFTRADFSKVIHPLKKTPLADERTCSTYQIRRASK